MATSQLEQLKAHGTVVSADTADVDAVEALRPQDATTNPTFLAAAVNNPAYKSLVSEAVETAATPSAAAELLCVLLGIELSKRVPGYVSSEVDARLSFDKDATLAAGRRIVGLYEARGVPRSRVLVKVAGTWEGIQAARELEAEGIGTNVTLVFSEAQAIAAAQAGATLISPFVGRMLDWHKRASGRSEYPQEQEPGVLSVKRIYHYFKAHGYKTIVMGASFRNVGEIRELAGVDRLTIAPKLLETLRDSTDPLPRKLSPEAAGEAPSLGELTEPRFRWLHNEDACATEKLAEGIRVFAKDTSTLEKALEAHPHAPWGSAA